MSKDDIRTRVKILLKSFKHEDPDGYLELIKEVIENERTRAI